MKCMEGAAAPADAHVTSEATEVPHISSMLVAPPLAVPESARAGSLHRSRKRAALVHAERLREETLDEERVATWIASLQLERPHGQMSAGARMQQLRTRILARQRLQAGIIT
eukprot:5721139-Karenia_brevis.AAC.1